ncbi:glycosyl hydrolase family 18 protein [Patescibacteria group bacterium]
MNKIILIVMGIMVVLFGFLIVQRRPSDELIEPVKMVDDHENLDEEKTTLDGFQYFAWIPGWEETRAIESLNKVGNNLQAISPVWYRLETSGEIVPIKTNQKEIILKLAQDMGLKVMPTVFNEFDSQSVTNLLTDQFLQEQLVTKLIDLAQENGYQGWDLDWEEIDRADNERFSNFVRFLAEELHKNDLLLSVTVHAQTGQLDDWDGSKGQNWLKLGQRADQIRIMAYDFHHSGTEPGPVTPSGKLRAVIGFALSQIPKEKIVLGLPTYGYDWWEKGAWSLQYTEAIKVITDNRGHWQYDSQEMAVTGQYVFENQKHQLWFENAQSIVAKINLATDLGVRNFIFWSLGGEDQDLWENIPS